MRLLSVTDRLSLRGGADLHLRDVLTAAAARGAAVTLACGRIDADAQPPPGVRVVVVRGLSRMVADHRRLSKLAPLLEQAEVVHTQNIMNPVALAQISATGRAIVTVQDHRVFCPGPGKTMPDGSVCQGPMEEARCTACLPDADYRRAVLALTCARRDALRGARLVVLSQYMADELAAVGLPGAAVIPPWIPVSEGARGPGAFFVLGGRLVSHKDSVRAWRAWDAAGRTLPLVIAGEGPLEAELEGTERRGWLGREALQTLLSQARALLFPTRWQEPFGILGAEALACGTPVICVLSGGMTDWAGEGCIHAESDEEMVEAIRALAAAPGHAVALGAAGRAAIRARFAEAELSARLWTLYEEVRCSPLNK
ncbi:MAG: glycosyltransferase involved in cell wall biosynthesis [Myxococcota bacterium]|jgi:glycosyltransferase involved in cell wall biosynthesis